METNVLEAELGSVFHHHVGAQAVVREQRPAAREMHLAHGVHGAEHFLRLVHLALAGHVRTAGDGDRGRHDGSPHHRPDAPPPPDDPPPKLLLLPDEELDEELEPDEEPPPIVHPDELPPLRPLPPALRNASRHD